MSEIALMGWKAIAEFLDVSERKTKKYRKELYETGTIFYWPRENTPKKEVCAFPSRLMAWIGHKSAREEIL